MFFISMSRPKVYKSQKDYYDKASKLLKKAVYDFYGNKCACCGENNPYFLQIDHVNNDGYKDMYNRNQRRYSGLTMYSRIIKEGFPDRFQILCANCNFGKKMNNGVCPHNNIN